MFRAIGLALLIGMAAQAASAQQIAPQLQADLNDLNSLVAPYLRVAQSADAMVTDYVPIIEQANAMAARGASDAEVDQWTQTWVPKLRAETSALQQLDRDVPALDPADVRRRVAPFNVTGKMDEAILSYPDFTHRLVSTVVSANDDLIRFVPAIAKGDGAAARLTAGRMFALARLDFEIVSANVSMQLASVEPTQPQYAYVQSVGSINASMGEMSGVMSAAASGETADTAAIAQRMRVQIDEGRKEAARIVPLANQIMARTPSATTPQDRALVARLARINALFGDTARVENLILDQLAAVAETIDAEGLNSSIIDRFKSMQTQLLSLNALENQRRQALLN